MVTLIKSARSVLFPKGLVSFWQAIGLERMGGVVIVVLAHSLLVAALIEAVWKGWSDYQLANRSMVLAKPPSTRLVSHKAVTDLNAIPTLHLFGWQAVGAGEDFPITRLALRLLGVLQTVDGRAAEAIISIDNQRGKVYRVHDAVSPEVRVEAINPTEVLLKSGDRIEKLPFNRPPLTFQGTPEPLFGGDNDAST